MSAKKYLEENYPVWKKVKDEDSLTKRVIIAVADGYAQQQIKLLNIPVVSVSVCPKCGSTDLFKSLKAELYDCKCCGLRWANER